MFLMAFIPIKVYLQLGCLSSSLTSGSPPINPTVQPSRVKVGRGHADGGVDGEVHTCCKSQQSDIILVGDVVVASMSVDGRNPHHLSSRLVWV